MLDAHTWGVVIFCTVVICVWFFGGVFLLLQLIKGLTGWDILADLWGGDDARK